MYEKNFFAGWGDIDFNSHMRNTAFLNKSGDIRMMFFADNGFPMGEFMRLGIGPVIMKDEIDYYKEIMLLEKFRIAMVVAGFSDDGSRFSIRNEFWKFDGKLAAKVTSTGGWLDLKTRRLTKPPEALYAAMRVLPRTTDFKNLLSSIR